ncbi:hypothetical protein D9611_011908 [Ephemerocybe angulata]|uniref:F-box domain-containing protein n=1 Tax=Ephemerocybe angulata TaxID=980116 RepID=A0A8H5BYN4_9AGAR|nr:hypothetical protein D9611_011908 [Tulosesus angulatus]
MTAKSQGGVTNSLNPVGRTRQGARHGRLGGDIGILCNNLLLLPQELLELVTGLLQCSDILTLRKCCQALKRISYSRPVWHRVFLACIGRTIPRPFFLPHPLHICTSAELEASVRMQECPRKATLASCEFRRGFRTEPKGPRVRARALLYPVPGGRYIIVADSDATLSYIDLHGKADPALVIRPFVPPPFAPTDPRSTSLRRWVTFDFASTQLRQPGIHHLSGFTLAIAISSLNGHSQVDIWKVDTNEGRDDDAESAHTPYWSARRVSSFKEAFFGTQSLKGFSLFGKHVAYTFETSYFHGIIIVDWEEADGVLDIDNLQRHYLMQPPALDISLLPDCRILALHECGYRDIARLHYWHRDGVMSRASPSKQRLEYIDRYVALGPMSAVGYSHRISSPFFTSDEVRIIIPSKEGVHGLRIPRESKRSEPCKHGEYMMTTLVAGNPDVSFATKWVYGHETAFSFLDVEDSKSILVMRYKWASVIQQITFCHF